MVLSLHTKSFKYPQPGSIHLRQAKDRGTLLWQRKTRKAVEYMAKKKKKPTQRKRCKTASLQPVLTDLQTGVQHSGKEKPKINQQKKSIPGYCIRKLQSYYLIQGKMPNFSFHTTFLPKRHKSHIHTNTCSQSHTLCCLGRSRLRFCQILIRMWRLGLREWRVGMTQNLNYRSL